MSLENLSEVLWSNSGGSTGLLDILSNNTGNSNNAFFTHSTHLSPGPSSAGDDPNTHNFLVGISIAVATSFIQSLGLTIQRKSHVMNEAIHPKELRRQACQRPLWHLGFHTYILSNLTGTIFSIASLPVIILAPLGAVTLVFNALFARLLLGDTFSRQSAAGTFLILLGAIMIGLFGVVPEPDHSLEDLIILWKRPTFIVYFSLIELTVVSLLVANRVVEGMLKRNAQAELSHHRQHHHHHRQRYGKMWTRSLGKLNPTRIKTMLGISYGIVGGMLSSQALLFAKSAIELLILTVVYGKNQFENPLSWFLVVALITAALLQLYYLNKGLRLCDTVLLVPLSFCAYNVSCLFNGLVYYNQWGRLHWWQILLVLFGISQVLVGVLVLAWRPAEEYGDESIDHDEDTLLLPNTSRPTTPRHSAVFSFKGPTGSNNGGSSGGGGGGGHGQHDSSMDARSLIQGFEMFDSDDDDLRTGADHEQDQRLITLATEDHLTSVEDSASLQTLQPHATFSTSPPPATPTDVAPHSPTLAFAPNTRGPHP